MTDTKIGCVQHDCAKCKAQADAIEALEAKAERLKSELSTTDVLLEECKMDWSGDVTQIKAEHKHEIAALQAQLAAAQGQEPVGFVESAVRGAGGFHACFRSGVFVPAGTRLYADPIPQQPAQQSQPECGYDDTAGNCTRANCCKQAQPERALTDAQEKVINFLLGADDLEGISFGDRNPERNGLFWWREDLRKAFHGIKQGAQHD